MLDSKGVAYSKFLEPDIGYALTAIAIVPGPQVKKLCSGIPLAGKSNSDPILEAEKIKRLKVTKDLIWEMQQCEQTSGMNMLDHGLSVRNHLFDLVHLLKNPETPAKYSWRLPSWVFPNAERIVYNLSSGFILDRYTIMHDCGKPACKTPSSNGEKVSYPDHAEASYQAWTRITEGAPDPELNKKIGDLIRRDMEIHTIRTPEEIQEFCSKGGRKQALTLLLTGLAEIHANAEMFGGMQSDSFKIKLKQLEKKGKLICEFLFPV